MLFYLTAAIVIAIDQVSKYLVRANMYIGQSIPEDGTAWFIRVSAIRGELSWVLTINAVSIAVIIFSYHYFIRGKKMPGVGLGLMLGSASNVIERLWSGYVTDFINGGAFIYNIADMALFSGVVVICSYFCWRWWIFVRG